MGEAPEKREMFCPRPFLGACAQRSWALPPVWGSFGAPLRLSSRGLGYSFASEDWPHLLRVPLETSAPLSGAGFTPRRAGPRTVISEVILGRTGCLLLRRMGWLRTHFVFPQEM